MMPKSVKRFSDDIMLYLFDLEPGEIRLMGSKMAVRDPPQQKTRGWAALVRNVGAYHAKNGEPSKMARRL